MKWINEGGVSLEKCNIKKRIEIQINKTPPWYINFIADVCDCYNIVIRSNIDFRLQDTLDEWSTIL